MFQELSEIKRLRKKHGLTQSGLAKRANVSQSLIAKIESGRIEPTYMNARRIFEVLNTLSKEKEHKASELMVRRIISCRSSDSVASAIQKMRHHNISQLPAIDRGVVAGLVTESNLIEVLASEKAISGIKIAEVMQDAPPVVSMNTPLSIIIDLLRYSPIILVSEGGRYAGVITKSDVLRFRSLG